MDMLLRRVEDVRAGRTDCKLYVVTGAMVPGQRLEFTAPPELVQLFLGRSEPVVALGRDRANIHTHGVEVTLRKLTPRKVVPNIHPEGTADIVLEAGRVCEVRTVTEGHRWLGRPARGRWIELDRARCVSRPMLDRSEALGAQAQEWIALVRASGRPECIAAVEQAVEQLGPMPAADLPNTRALWVAGLINPLPKLGLAREVRPEVLMAPSVERRLSAVEAAIAASLRTLQEG